MRSPCFIPLLALAACGPETTSFRTTDRADASEPAAAAYSIPSRGRDVAGVRVSSNGGYISATDEPTTHVHFDIRNTSPQPIIFDNDAIQLVVFGKNGVPLPPTTLTSVTPLGPARVSVAPGTMVSLDAYFLLSVRPRTVETMRVHWSLDLAGARYEQTTSFVRDDDYPVTAPPANVEQFAPST